MSTEVPPLAPGALSATASSVASRVRWNAVAPTLLVVWIVSMFDKSNIAIVIADPKFLADLGLAGKPAMLGWLVSSLFLGYGLAAPAWGWAVAGMGPRRAASLSLLVWAAACFASGLAAGYGVLLASRIVLGLGEAALFPVTLALVANWFPLRERGRATAYWWIGTMIGPMLTGLLITTLILTLGWRAQFYALGILALILPLPMVWFLVRDTPAESPATSRAEVELIAAGSIENSADAPGEIFKTTSSAWRNYRYWLVVVALSCNNIFFWGWSLWLPTYLKTTRHFSFGMSGYLTFVIFGFAVATIIAVGHFSDRIFRRAPLAGLGWGMGGVLLIAAALVPSATASVVLMIMALCAQQVGVSSGEMLMHSVVSARDMGLTQGVRAFATQLVGALAPVMIGYVLHFTGSFTGGFAILGGAIVISAACMVVLSRQGL